MFLRVLGEFLLESEWYRYVERFGAAAGAE
jgi:hypothetical protein